ncbi:DUF4457 domain-containing protein [Meloidogyne graminicola]|uniref:DUF4457 domain-containing protein n=1 Tax=Meloidogyne graminicola TaxID=189291 RepID=A0A8T0A1X6_9BILA|nr:DUF4457 domain-containing protein [Meloidogyne graminicola]
MEIYLIYLLLIIMFCNYRILPSDSSEPIHISLRFHGVQTLAMIRIWNYSGSRIHALRGVRNLRIWLDNNCIFYGEICCAVGNSTTQGDTILFTINEEILAKIAEHDEQISQQITEFTIEQQQQHNPITNAVGMETLIQSSALPNVNTVPFRPITGYNNFAQSSTSSPHSLLVISDGEYSEQNYITENQKIEEIENEEEEEELNYSNNINGKLFHIEILENWGSTEYIGLTGIQFLGPGFSPINENIVKECVIRCEPVINEELKRGELKNLLNGINLTCDPENMWITNKLILNNSEDEISKQSSIFLSFTFPKEISISGISIWNYNASTELSYVGVRCARFYANGKLINGIGDILLRKAPGFVFFDFVQDVLFDRCLLQRPLSCARPQTLIYQLRLLSTWGDEFYIGLNGIELFNRHDKIINLHPQNLAAFPESVNCLTSVRDDPRTSDKLIDGCNDTTKVYHMWLTPILPNSYARVFIIFDTPTFVTRIRIYNYRKTPERGVRHIALSADDLLLCSGAEVPASSPESTGILDLPLRDVDEN